MKKVLFTMALLVAASGAFAQQSVIKEAKKLMKPAFLKILGPLIILLNVFYLCSINGTIKPG